MHPLIAKNAEFPGLLGGGLRELYKLYNAHQQASYESLLSAVEDEDILKRVRRMQGAAELMDFIKSRLDEEPST